MPSDTPTDDNPSEAASRPKPLDPDVVVPEEFEDEELYKRARRGTAERPSSLPEEDMEEIGPPGF